MLIEISKKIAAFVVLVVAISSVSYQFFRSERLNLVPDRLFSVPSDITDKDFNGCGWDGLSYCIMFYGSKEVPSPYSRRIAAPFVAKMLNEAPIQGFTLLNYLSLLVSIIFIMLIFRTNLNPRNSKDFFLYLILLFSIAITSRNTLKLNFTSPVITDHFALAILLLGAYLLIKKDAGWISKVIGCSTVFIAPLSRENTGICLMFGATIALYYSHINKKYFALYLLSGSLGTALALLQSHNNIPQPLFLVLLGHVIEIFHSKESFVKFLFQILIALGIFWVPLLYKSFLKRLDNYSMILLSIFSSFLITSIFGGADTERILMPAGILLFITIARIWSQNNFDFFIFFIMAVQFILSQDLISVAKNSNIQNYYGIRYLSNIELVEHVQMPIFYSILISGLILSLILKITDLNYPNKIQHQQGR